MSNHVSEKAQERWAGFASQADAKPTKDVSCVPFFLEERASLFPNGERLSNGFGAMVEIEELLVYQKVALG